MNRYFFKIELAEKKIEVECFYKYVFYVCRDYLVEFEKPDLVVRSSLEEIRCEAIKTFGDEIEELDERIAVEYVDSESKLILRKIADALLNSHVLLIHGAAIAINGKCYIFIADSGTGKTTHIQNWIKKIPGTIVVNGDKPLVDVKRRIVYGSPWCGKEGLNTNTSCLLAGIISLERGNNNSISSSCLKEILPNLLNQTYIPSEIESLMGYQLLGQLKSIPCYKLICNMDEESAVVAYNGLCNKNEDIHV